MSAAKKDREDDQELPHKRLLNAQSQYDSHEQCQDWWCFNMLQAVQLTRLCRLDDTMQERGVEGPQKHLVS